MLRLAAAHRGAVRAIQSFVNQQLPLQDLRRGLPTGYHELALLIRQLALVSTQIKANKDTSEVHEDLVKMLDRVDVSFLKTMLQIDKSYYVWGIAVLKIVILGDKLSVLYRLFYSILSHNLGRSSGHNR